MINEILRLVTDKYDRRARLYPALLAALPASLLALALAPALPSAAALGSVIVASGLPILAMHFARSSGKRLESKLYSDWGGRPTTALLRFSGAGNRTQVQRRHALLQRLVGASPTMPTAAAERSAPRKADDIYDTAVGALREATRDKLKFNLVFAELCDYGYRRNLVGLKPVGLALTVLSLLGAAGLHVFTPGLVPALDLGLIAVVDLAMVIWWLAGATQNWVKESAYAYAETLMAALEKI